MRGLVYAVKDNRDRPNRKQPIQHPLHPQNRPVLVNRDNAIEYVTAILAQRVPKLARFFGAEDPRAVTLVPVPSSEVTSTTIESARFRTLRLCRALAGVGLGTVAVLAVQRAPVIAKTANRATRRSARQIFEGLARTSVPIPRSGAIVLVDDNVQSGSSLAALDLLLGVSRATAAFAVAVTDARPCHSALAGRGFVVDYDEGAPDLDVTCTLSPPR
ncbi:MAG: hypothetical protein ACTHU0_13925 [Kofleriaceae bacterium]